MKKSRRYLIDGIILDIPLRYDAQSGIYLEEYPDFIGNPVWTAHGNPVMFAGEDACPHAEEATPGGCPDCGSCRHYRPAGIHSWIGVCHSEKKQRAHGYVHDKEAMFQ